jgi:hypothetical protein
MSVPRQVASKLFEAFKHYTAGHSAYEAFQDVVKDLQSEYTHLKEDIEEFVDDLTSFTTPSKKQKGSDSKATSYSFNGQDITPDQIGHVKPPSPRRKPAKKLFVDDEDGSNESVANLTDSPQVNIMSEDQQSGNLKETKVTRVENPSYGLQETHTTILPLTTCISVGGLDLYKQAQCGIRLTSIRMPFIDVFETDTPVARNFCFGIRQRGRDHVVAGNRTPMVYNASTSHTEQVALLPKNGYMYRKQFVMRDYWTEFYEYYHVLGCEYELVIDNISGQVADDVLLGTMECTKEVPPKTMSINGNEVEVSAFEALNWKNTKWHCITSDPESGRNRYIIKGHYKTGQAGRDVHEDGDVNTWTPVANNPTLPETLRLFAYRHPMSQWNTENDVQNTTLNIMVKMKLICQFKDLKRKYKFPTGVNYGSGPVGSEEALVDLDARMDGNDATN